MGPWISMVSLEENLGCVYLRKLFWSYNHKTKHDESDESYGASMVYNTEQLQWRHHI